MTLRRDPVATNASALHGFKRVWIANGAKISFILAWREEVTTAKAFEAMSRLERSRVLRPISEIYPIEQLEAVLLNVYPDFLLCLTCCDHEQEGF